MVQAPAQVTGSHQNQLSLVAQACTHATHGPSSVQSPCIADPLQDSSDSVATLVGELEALPQDSVASTVRDVKMKSGRAVPAGATPAVGDSDSTLEWINQQIWAIEHRRDGCEMRRAHFADLRRRIGEGERGMMTKDGDSLLAKERDSGSSLLRRLAMLEGEHDQIRKEVEDERRELLRLRNGLKDVGKIQSIAKDAREAEQQNRPAEDTSKLHTLRELGQLDIAQESAGEDYRQLEEASRAVLGDCRELQQRVRELEVERAALIDAHASAEQERRSLQAKIKQMEAEMSLEISAKVEAQCAQLREGAHRELKLLRENIEIDCSRRVEELKSQQREEWDAANSDQLDQQRRELSSQLEAMRQERDKLEVEKAAEAEARGAAEQRHQEALRDIENLQHEQSKLQEDKERQLKEKEETIKKHDDDFAQLQSEKESETRAKEELDRRHVEETQRLKSVVCKLEADKAAATRVKEDCESQHATSQKEGERLEAAHQKLQVELHQVIADRDEETERLRIQHHGMRVADQKLIDEMQAKLLELDKNRFDTVAGLRREMDQLEQRHGETHRTESGQIQSLRFELDNACKKCEALEQELKELKETGESQIKRLQKEKAEITADLDRTRKQKEDMREAESALQSTQIQQLQAQLSEAAVRKEQDCGREQQLRSEVNRILEQLQHEQQEGETLKLALTNARNDLQQNSKDAMQKSEQLKQQLETTWRQKLEEKDAELQALKNAQSTRRSLSVLEAPQTQQATLPSGSQASLVEDRPPRASLPTVEASQTQQASQPSVSRASLLVEPMGTVEAWQSTQLAGSRSALSRTSLLAEPVLPALEDDEIQKMDHPFVVKMRETHASVGIAMANADQVHLTSLQARFLSASDSLNNGKSPSSGFYDYKLKSQTKLESQAAASRLESRMRDLVALREETSHLNFSGSTEKQRILGYIDRDMARCEEETQILKPSATGDVPEALIRVIITFISGEGPREYTRGFSPAHWAAEKGRRDLLLFILQLRGGEAMLQAIDNMGRTPLFYADRSKRIGLVYWVQSVLGSGVPSFKPVEKRPEVSKLPSAYKKLLEQIESHGWHSVTWKDNVTMLHWAAGKGNKDLCAYLVQLNADPSVRDSQARTPASCAAAAGHHSIAQFLEDAQVSARRTSYSKLAFNMAAATE